MTDGTSQGLFIVVAIVIFGIFVVMAYILFEDTLSPALANMFTDATETANTRLQYSKDYIVNGSFDEYVEADYGWDETLNSKYIPKPYTEGRWSRGFNAEVLNAGEGYHAHLNIEKFRQPVMSLTNKNNLIADVPNQRWIGFSHTWKPSTEFVKNLKVGTVVELSFDMWSDSKSGIASTIITQYDSVAGDFKMLEGTAWERATVTKEGSWERKVVEFPITKELKDDHNVAIYFYGHEEVGSEKYIDNIEVRIKR